VNYYQTTQQHILDDRILCSLLRENPRPTTVHLPYVRALSADRNWHYWIVMLSKFTEYFKNGLIVSPVISYCRIALTYHYFQRFGMMQSFTRGYRFVFVIFVKCLVSFRKRSVICYNFLCASYDRVL